MANTRAQKTAQNLSTLTTAGDIAYASAAGTPARLGIGSTSQVLTVASGVPSWATPAATGFVGCGLYRSGVATIPNNSGTFIDWDSERFDTNAFHSTATNTSRITIPAGYAGKYLITWQIGWNFNATGYRQVQVFLNGAALGQSYNLCTFNGYATQSAALVYSLSVSDYLQIEVAQSSGGNLDSSNTQDFFSVVYLGA